MGDTYKMYKWKQNHEAFSQYNEAPIPHNGPIMITKLLPVRGSNLNRFITLAFFWSSLSITNTKSYFIKNRQLLEINSGVRDFWK